MYHNVCHLICQYFFENIFILFVFSYFIGKLTIISPFILSFFLPFQLFSFPWAETSIKKFEFSLPIEFKINFMGRTNFPNKYLKADAQFLHQPFLPIIKFLSEQKYRKLL